jgi:hypothetical protein
MIPTNQKLNSRLDSNVIRSLILQPTNYFQIADEYVSLQKKFVKETFFEKIGLWFDMLISPLITIVQLFMNGMDIFLVYSLHKVVSLWKDWFRMKYLQTIIREWRQIVKQVGGPFITCNDAEYHLFVYADAMQRILDSLLLTKKRTKRAE